MNKGKRNFSQEDYGETTAPLRSHRNKERLRKALDRNELVLHFQPQFDRRGRLIGAEALVRWHHPEKGLLPPGDFIPLAEQTGLIDDLDNWVLHAVCRQHQEWSRRGIPVPRIAVNLSAGSLLRRDLLPEILDTLRQTGMDPRDLELELTESVLVADLEQTVQMLHELKDLGISIALDDFGTGYSSPYYLMHFPLDKIKIDRAFVQSVTSNPKSATLTRTIIQLAHDLGFQVLAEGVENEAQRSFLLDKGCDQMQGFLLGRPMPATDFARLLTKPATSPRGQLVPGPWRNSGFDFGREYLRDAS